MSNKKYTFTARDGKKYSLTEKEKAFCEFYCEFGTKGIEAVYRAGYKAKTKAVAYSISSENLRKPQILAYIDTLYEEFGFTDEEVMREHWFLIKQNADFSNKARAIDMYYKKMGYYKPERNTVIYRDSKYAEMPYEELLEIYSKRVKHSTSRKMS